MLDYVWSVVTLMEVKVIVRDVYLPFLRFELVHLPKKDRCLKARLRLGVTDRAFFGGASHRSAELVLVVWFRITSTW